MTDLARTFGLGPERTVLDLAAGTGKLTRRLAGHAGRVIAVEPVVEMLDVLRARLRFRTEIHRTRRRSG